MKKKLIILGVILVVGWFTWMRFFASSTKPVQFQTGTAENGTLVKSVTASGNITAGNSLPITTSATGVVTAVYVKNGDVVTQGQKIADLTLDQTSLQRQTAAWAAYLGAQNSLNSAQSNLYSLQNALFKANQTFVNDKGVPNPTDTQKTDPVYVEELAGWLAAEANYKNQQGVIGQAQQSLSSAWLSYQQASSTISAPIAGTVGNLSIAQGAVITGSTSSTGTASTQTLGTVAAGGGPQALVAISEIDSPNVKLGQKATMTLDAFPNKTFTGKVILVNTNGTVSSGVTTYPATIVFDDPTVSMYPNMAVTAKIIANVESNVLLVPTAAIQTSGGSSTVRVLKNGQVTTVDVQVGDSNDTETVVTSGLSAGDVVVTGTPPVGGAGSRTTTNSPFGGGGFGGGGGAVFRRIGG